MTPIEIEVLLYAYYSPTEHPRSSTMAIMEAQKRLVSDEIIARVPSEANIIFTTTERGAAHVRQLCKLPLPAQGWVNANGEGV